MVQFRNRRYRRRKAYRKPRKVSKTWAASKKSSSSQASQIMALQRQINRLDLRTRDSLKYVQYHLDLSSPIGTVTGPSHSTWNLIQPDLWQPIFQTKTSEFQALTPDKFRGRSIGLEIMAQIGEMVTGTVPSLDPITCTLFVASLRKEVAKQFVDQTSNGVNLVEDVHFCKAQMGTLQGSGMVMLNKGIFKIRYVKRFMLGGNTDFYKEADDEPVSKTTNLKDNNRRMYIKLPYKNLLKDDGPDNRDADEPSGFKTLTVDTVDPADQLYVFCFANSYADQTVSLHGNMVITGVVNNN